MHFLQRGEAGTRVRTLVSRNSCKLAYAVRGSINHRPRANELNFSPSQPFAKGYRAALVVS